MSLTFKLTEDIPEPSTSVQELNNELTKMRKTVKIAKLFVGRDLSHYAQKLRSKSTKQPENTKISKKLQHRLDDIKLLRHLTVNRLCKRLLANEEAADIAQMGHKLSSEDRLIARLRSTKPVANFISTFRKQHEDWRSLIHYLLYKNVSGKWKSRKQKRKGRTVCGSLPLPPGPSVDLVQDVSDEHDENHYRVPNTSTTNETERVIPNLLDKPDDPDSDAASDIAEAVVARLLQSSQSESVANLDHILPNRPSTSRSSSQGEGKLQVKTKSKKKSKLNSRSKDSPDVADAVQTADTMPSTPQSMEDEDILGTDDIAMQKETKKQFRKHLLFEDDSNPKKRRALSYEKRPRPAPAQIPKRPKPQHIQSTSKRPTTSSRPETASSNLHPSWQAKREQRQKLVSVSKAPLSQTKHIVFDD